MKIKLLGTGWRKAIAVEVPHVWPLENMKVITVLDLHTDLKVIPGEPPQGLDPYFNATVFEKCPEWQYPNVFFEQLKKEVDIKK